METITKSLAKASISKGARKQERMAAAVAAREVCTVIAKADMEVIRFAMEEVLTQDTMRTLGAEIERQIAGKVKEKKPKQADEWLTSFVGSMMSTTDERIAALQVELAGLGSSVLDERVLDVDQDQLSDLVMKLKMISARIRQTTSQLNIEWLYAVALSLQFIEKRQQLEGYDEATTSVAMAEIMGGDEGGTWAVPTIMKYKSVVKLVLDFPRIILSPRQISTICGHVSAIRKHLAEHSDDAMRWSGRTRVDEIGDVKFDERFGELYKMRALLDPILRDKRLCARVADCLKDPPKAKRARDDKAFPGRGRKVSGGTPDGADDEEDDDGDAPMN